MCNGLFRWVICYGIWWYHNMLWSWELIFSYLIVSYLPEYIAISYYCVFLESMSSGTVDGSRDHLWMSTLYFSFPPNTYQGGKQHWAFGDSGTVHGTIGPSCSFLDTSVVIICKTRPLLSTGISIPASPLILDYLYWTFLLPSAGTPSFSLQAVVCSW